MGFRNMPEMKPTNKPQFAGGGFDFGGGGTPVPTKTSDLINDSGFIESSMISGTESTDTASQAYNVGDFFISSTGQLCKVTDEIAEGGTIVLNTNCVPTTVGGELTDLTRKIPKTTVTNKGLNFNFYRRGDVVVVDIDGTTTESINWDSLLAAIPVDYQPMNPCAFTVTGRNNSIGKTYVLQLSVTPSLDAPYGSLWGNDEISSGTIVGGQLVYLYNN